MAKALRKMPDPGEFTTNIDNPYFTLRPGTTFIYDNAEGGEQVTIEVLHRTRVVNGVTCVVVHDEVRLNGRTVEDTYDWYAQDSDGNVWYLGERTAEIDPVTGDVLNHNGAWEAGVEGAKAGIYMLADPEPGDTYYQEFWDGKAEDFAAVLTRTGQVATPYIASVEALVTNDINPLGPQAELKYYVEGVGPVLGRGADGEREQLTKVIVNGRSGADDLEGYVGGDEVNGRGGNDRLRGLEGNDTLNGGAGRDRLAGNTGFDRLDGGAGNDRMIGGQDGDTFVFGNLSDGRADIDTIRDYDLEELDLIAIDGGVAAIAGEALVGGVWELTLTGDGDVIRVNGAVDTNADGSILDDLLFA